MKLFIIIFLIKWFTVYADKKDHIARYSTGGSNLRYLKWNVFSSPNKESGKRVEAWHRGYKENPEFLGTYVEGDILFPNHFIRNGVINETKRWPFGIVVYEFSNNLNFIQKFSILRAMIAFRKNTCIRFRKKTWHDEDYVLIEAKKVGCYSSVGRIGGIQRVNLHSPSCFRSGTIIHELMHVIGFAHEQSRYDRDEYIRIILENISPAMIYNFHKVDHTRFSDFGFPYDYRSIMHYSNYAFTINNLETMVAKDGVNKLGLADYFTKLDLKKVKRMYSCHATTTNSNTLITFLVPLLLYEL